MKECPNCNTITTDPRAKYCPHCGSPFWPTGTKRLLTGYEWLDVLLGVIAVAVSPIVFGVGFLLAILFYFLLRDTYPAFASGMRVALLTYVVLFLGALIVCLGLIGRMH